jgi:hypothetical protein
MPAGRRYTDAERDEILRRAIAAQEGSDDITHEELVDAAQEIGIDPAMVESAAEEIAKERVRREEASEDDGLVAAEVSRRRGRFGRHLLTYLLVNGGLVAMNLASGGEFWAIWPILAWGLGLALQAMRALPAPGDDDRERILRRLSKRRAKQARERAKRARNEAMRAAGQEFEAAVEQGVAELLRAVSRGLSAGAAQPSSEARRGPPRARVEVEDAEVSEPIDGRARRSQRERR